MLTPLNGILIVVLTFAFGLFTRDMALVASAFAMAGVSYVGDFARDLDEVDGPPWRAIANLLFWVSAAIGVYAYARVFSHIIGG